MKRRLTSAHVSIIGLILSFVLLYVALGYAFYKIGANQARIVKIETVIKGERGPAGPIGPTGVPGLNYGETQRPAAPTRTPSKAERNVGSPAPTSPPRPAQSTSPTPHRICVGPICL